MIKIDIQTISHSDQRYPTVGDWWQDEFDNHHIRVSDMGNSDYEFLVALHEMIEQHFCLKEGISEESVSTFDKQFEAMREAFPVLVGDDEPGNSVRAPYNHEHLVASRVERWVSDMLFPKNPDIAWAEYEKVVNELQDI